MEDVQKIEQYLQLIDIEPPTTKIYLALLQQGPCSALQLAKATQISRTQVYRHLEALQAVHLVSSEQLSYGTLFRALPMTNVEAIIAQREAHTHLLKQDLGAMQLLLQHIAGAQGPTTTAHHYYGVAGLKQANWNLTKADGNYYVFEAAHLSQHLDKTFTRHFRERAISKNLTSHDLTNKSEIFAKDIEPFNPALTHYRHISPDILAISFEVYVYNTTVTLLDYSKENPHAIEITHPTLHGLMFQLHQAMWRLGTPLKLA